MSQEGPLFFLMAGEASGDLIGARLMAALTEQTQGSARFAGVGGERMMAQGLEPLFPMQELAVFGLVEVLRHIPRLLGRIRQTAQAAHQMRPAAVIGIDAPDFCLRVAKRLKGRGIPLVHYVAPSVWAWRPGRARKVAKILDHLLTLLPFEPPYFEREGLATTFVGHPIIESDVARGDGARFRLAHHITPEQPVLVVLPGSRAGEIRRLAPIFGQTLDALARRFPDLSVVVPTLPSVAGLVAHEAQSWPVHPLLLLGDTAKYDAFAAADVALAASGTVSVELAMAGVPSIIGYRVNPLSAMIFRMVTKIRYASLLNLMEDRMVIPEFLQQYCRPDVLAPAVTQLLEDPTARQRQREVAARLPAWLGAGPMMPSARAARTVLSVAGIAPKETT
ncbi:MAG: lipid-A-disaccharide synthase [Alphaproteobacteria bacterium]|nr:MAG: lipid-A-disaccharide synthase [Alphaproteobacteria bacterium]